MSKTNDDGDTTTATTTSSRRTVAPPPQLHFDDGTRAMMEEGEAIESRSVDNDLLMCGRDVSISIEEYYEIERWTNEIYQLVVNANKKNTGDDGSVATSIKVALQFPDNLLVDSPQVCWLLEQSVSDKMSSQQQQESTSSMPSPLIFVLGDTTVASCCPDVVAAQHLNADLLIHYGSACWSHDTTSEKSVAASTATSVSSNTSGNPNSKLPFIGYTLGHQPLNIATTIQHIQDQLKEINDDPPQKLLIVYEPVYHQSVRDLQMELQNSDTPLSTIVTANIPRFASKSIASTMSSPPQADTKEDVDGGHELEDPSSNTPLVLGGLELPIESITSWNQLSEYAVLYISEMKNTSDTGTSRQHVSILLRLLSLPEQPQHIWTYTPSRQDSVESALSTTIPISIQKRLKRRFFLTQKARSAQVFGILVSSHVSYSSNVIRIIKVVQQKIQHSLRQNGGEDAASSCYILAVGKINPAKLANFAEIDCFVLISCEQTSLLENERDYHVPVITPLELDIALGYQNWGEQIYTLQVNDIIKGNGEGGDGDSDDDEDVEEEGEEEDDDDSDAPFFSLVTGKYESSRKTSKNEPLDLQALPGQGQVLAYQSDAASFLKQREYQGLDPMLGQTEAKPATTGQRGIASNYEGS